MEMPTLPFRAAWIAYSEDGPEDVFLDSEIVVSSACP